MKKCNVEQLDKTTITLQKNMKQIEKTNELLTNIQEKLDNYFRNNKKNLITQPLKNAKNQFQSNKYFDKTFPQKQNNDSQTSSTNSLILLKPRQIGANSKYTSNIENQKGANLNTNRDSIYLLQKKYYEKIFQFQNKFQKLENQYLLAKQQNLNLKNKNKEMKKFLKEKNELIEKEITQENSLINQNKQQIGQFYQLKSEINKIQNQKQMLLDKLIKTRIKQEQQNRRLQQKKTTKKKIHDKFNKGTSHKDSGKKKRKKNYSTYDLNEYQSKLKYFEKQFQRLNKIVTQKIKQKSNRKKN